MQHFVALDFETANRNPSSVCSIGLVFVADGRLVDSYYHLIRPIPNYYSAFNTYIHGISAADTRRAPPFPAIWQEVLPKIAGLPLVAHNSPFDAGCLRAVLAAYGLPPQENRFYCTCRQARKTYPNLPNHKLATVARYLGIPLERHHHALADAEACARIALHVFDGAPIALNKTITRRANALR